MKHSLAFFGTTEGSQQLLAKLLSLDSISIDLVVTKKSKPAGRGLETVSSPVARYAKDNNLAIIEIEKTIEALEYLKQSKPEVYVVVDFGKIIPNEILSIPRLGALNLHLSFLPTYRGASPIVAPILNGDTETGFSYMMLDEEMDHGPILYQEKAEITPDDTAGTLEKRLFEKGIEKLEYVLAEFLTGALKPVEQDHSKATITKLIQKEDAAVDFSKETADVIERKVRAYHPAPYAFFFHKGKRIQIIKSKKQGIKETKDQFEKTSEGIVARCANNTRLLLEIIRPEGKQARSSKEFEQYF